MGLLGGYEMCENFGLRDSGSENRIRRYQINLHAYRELNAVPCVILWHSSISP